jgi:hypothetical protein
MGIELLSETRIVVGRLGAPADPDRPWWWESSTKGDGVEMIVAGFARTESDAILEAAASTLDLRAAIDAAAVPAVPASDDTDESDPWRLNGARAPERDRGPARSTSG